MKIEKQQQAHSTTIASWAQFVLSGVNHHGGDGAKVLQHAQISTEELSSPNLRIDVARMTKLWEAACREANDPCFPLRLAELIQPDTFSGFGLALRFSTTVGEAVQRMCDFSAVASNAAQLELVKQTDGNIAVILHLTTVVADEAMEAFMACGARILNEISNHHCQFVEVHFAHDKSQHRQRFETVFQSPVVFNSSHYKFVASPETLALPCHQANPEVASSLDSWMADYLHQQQTETLIGKVKKQLLMQLNNGDVDLSVVAKELAMSPRALQRALQQQGQSYRELLDTTRRDVATKLLRRNDLSLTEIYCQLGFTDQSNFTKAFKRWTGTTPRDYRLGHTQPIG